MSVINRYTDPDTFRTDPPRLNPEHASMRNMMGATHIVEYLGDVDLFYYDAIEAHQSGDTERVADMMTLARTGVLELIASGQLNAAQCTEYAQTLLRHEATMRDDAISA